MDNVQKISPEELRKHQEAAARSLGITLEEFLARIAEETLRAGFQKSGGRRTP